MVAVTCKKDVGMRGYVLFHFNFFRTCFHVFFYENQCKSLINISINVSYKI